MSAQNEVDLRSATRIALSPHILTKRRERERVERFILATYATPDERALYATVRKSQGFIMWDMLRQILARAYE